MLRYVWKENNELKKINSFYIIYAPIENLRTNNYYKQFIRYFCNGECRK